MKSEADDSKSGPENLANDLEGTRECEKRPAKPIAKTTTPEPKVRQGSTELQQLADEVQRLELPLDYQDELYQLSTIRDSYEEGVYRNIRRSVEGMSWTLENTLGDLLEKKTLTKEEKNRRQRELLKHAKLLVRRLEKNNHLHIFIFKSATGTWWKMGGNSIAIHGLTVATYLDREIKINADLDMFGQFRAGVICLQDEQRLQKDIAYSGAPLRLDTEIDFGPFQNLIRAYRLRVPLNDSELKRFREVDAEALRQINRNTFSVSPEVELDHCIVTILRSSYYIEQQIDDKVRQVIAHPLIDSIFKLRRAYYDMANHAKRDPAHWQAIEQIDTCIADAMSVLASYADLGIVNRSLVARTSLDLAKARELVRRQTDGVKK